MRKYLSAKKTSQLAATNTLKGSILSSKSSSIAVKLTAGLTLLSGLVFSNLGTAAPEECPKLEGVYDCQGDANVFVGKVEVRQSVTEAGVTIYYLPFDPSQKDRPVDTRIADGVRRTYKEQTHAGTLDAYYTTKCLSKYVLLKNDEVPGFGVRFMSRIAISKDGKSLKISEKLSQGTTIRLSSALCKK